MEIITHFFDINTTFFTVLSYPMSYIEFFGTVFNILCVWLVSRNKISNRPIGILGVILYIFLFYQIQLYADLIEQWYFLITWFYGRWAWTHIKKDKKENTTWITQTTFKENIIYWLVTIIFTFIFAYIIKHLSIRFPVTFPEPASYPYLDSFTTVLSFVATILMARKKVSCRYLRIVVDIIGIGLYYVKWVKFISLEYVIFLVLASIWLFQWLKLYRHNKSIGMD
jgi:nicotinamide mononucleotide transporter